MNKTRIPTMLALAVAAAVTPAYAQSDNETAQSGLEVIEITSQHRTENVQKAALAVSAISTKQLEKSGITQPDQLSFLVPALQINKTGGTGNSFYVRGVGTQGTNAFAENAVAFNYDGVYIGRPGSVVGTFFDLERLELLKGPQG
ncbi:MAG: Plug domain-containing protein, partial [Pseudomonadota bacterium]|nr:Plug domain-containing protein [Pseudomonadota bacterium]